MSAIRITKEFRFEMAHTLAGYDGACSEIHGHSYRLFVTVAGTPASDPDDPKYGMVMDFSILKKIVSNAVLDRYDHSLMIRRTESNGDLIAMLQREFGKIHAVDYQPTCENLVIRIAHDIAPLLPEGIKLHSMRLHETATSFAEWHAADN